MRSDYRHRRCCAGGIAMGALFAGSSVGGLRSADAAELEWIIAPYVWAADVRLDATIGGSTVGATVPFEDLVHNLEAAFMGHAEVRGQRFGGFATIDYVSLADQQTKSFGPGGPVLGDVVVDSDVKLELYELAGLYRLGRRDADMPRFDLLFGVRLIDMRTALDFTLPGPAGGRGEPTLDVSETDAFVGARVAGDLGKRFGYRARADYGGGGSHGTLNLLATFSYTVGRKGTFSVDWGYRHCEIDLSGSSGVDLSKTKMTLSGPLLGFAFAF